MFFWHPRVVSQLLWGEFQNPYFHSRGGGGGKTKNHSVSLFLNKGASCPHSSSTIKGGLGNVKKQKKIWTKSTRRGGSSQVHHPCFLFTFIKSTVHICKI